MKDSWKGFALSVAVGLILGGGAAAAIGERNLQIEVARLERQIDEVKADEEKTYDVVIELSIAMARVEEKLDASLAR